MKQVFISKNFKFVKTNIFLVSFLLIIISPTQIVFSSTKNKSNIVQAPTHLPAGMIVPTNTTIISLYPSGYYYNEQIAETFTQSFTSMAFNVTAVAQVDNDGYGIGYLLNGLSDKGYWYQVGLSYDWSTPGTGFKFVYEVWDPTGNSIFPSNSFGGELNFSGIVNAGDIIGINLYYGKDSYAGEVVMYVKDYTTGAYAYQTYSAKGASQFVGNANATTNEKGFFTGLMTEQYHSKPYYNNGQLVKYSEKDFALTSAWQWIGERNLNTKENIFYQRSYSPVAFDNYYQLHKLETNGVTEYTDAYDFYTGENPVSMNLSTTTIITDSGMQVQTPIKASVTGGTAPYTYLVYLDNKLIQQYTSNIEYSTILHFGLPSVGQHQYYVNVHDSNGYPASSQIATFTVNANPTLMISSQPTADKGQVISINYQSFLGTPPYITTLYLNGVALPQTNQDSIEISKLGNNQLYAALTDAAGVTVFSNTISIQVNPDPIVSLSPTSSVTDAGLPITYTESVVNGTTPYWISWLVNDQQVPGSTDTNFKFVSNSSTTYLISVQIMDRTGFVVKSTPSTIIVNTDPVISSYSSTGQSTNFFFTNNAAQSKIDISGGSAPFIYEWYLNGLKVAQTSELSYTYTFSSMGPNVVSVKVSDAAGYMVQSETTTINFGFDFLHIGTVVAIIVIALILVISRRGKERVLETTQPEKPEPIITQPETPSTLIAEPENQEPTIIQKEETPELITPSVKPELTLVQPQPMTTPKAPTSHVTEDPVAILKLRYAKGEINKGQYEEIVTSPASEDPVAILKLRYAKGEITKEQYAEALKILRD